jgi:uncharacterized membrane protein
MTLAPILAASPIIQLHGGAAIAALLIGAAQLAGRTSGAAHRALGWTWVGLMALVAASSFGIRTLDGGFGVIHGLSLLTLAALPVLVLHARRRRVRSHRIAAISMYSGALVVTGAFTLLPGRILGRALFGG